MAKIQDKEVANLSSNEPRIVSYKFAGSVKLWPIVPGGWRKRVA